MSTSGSIQGTHEEPTTASGPPKRMVYVHVNFIKLGEVNTLKETFDAEIMIKSRWREPRLDGQKGNVALGDQWNPQIFIENAVGTLQMTVSLEAETNDRQETFVVERKKFRGTFVELMELWDFPFDVQELSILIMSPTSAHDTRLIDDPEEMHTMHKRSFVDEQEFYLYKYIESNVPPLSIDQQTGLVKQKRPRMRVTINVARLPHYFIWNVFLIMNVILLVSFTSFGIEVKSISIRLQHCFLMVLAVVTFKNVVNSHTPKISYFTYLDAYMVTMLVLLAVIASWHGFMTRVAESSRASVDRIGLICCVAIYVLFHICFCANVLIKPYRKRRRMGLKEEEYQGRYSAALKTRNEQTAVKTKAKH